jgi:DNA-binding transcriptional ArsR family regulator
MEQGIWTDEMLEDIAESFRILGSPVRIRILQLLSKSDASVGTIVEQLGLHQALVSQHLKLLWMSKFVVRTKDGNKVIYKLARPEVLTIFNCIEKCHFPLAANGNGVAI